MSVEQEEAAPRMVIGGRPVLAQEERRSDVFEPARGRPLAQVPEASEVDIAAAVSAGLEAVPAWRALGPVERGERVAALGAALEREVESFARLDARNAGNPIVGMQRGAAQGARTLRYFAGLGMQLAGQTIPATPDHLHYTVREPFGVVGVITPFNHPTLFAAARIAAPLMAGNAVVLKPAHQTPLSALRLGMLAREYLPDGVLNVVTGGATAGSALVRHPKVRRLGFTGSVATALRIQSDAVASGVIKRLSFELGGKNPMIVLPDADVDRAAEAAVEGMNLSRVLGQSCGSTSRLFVHRDQRAAMLERVVDRVRALRFGDPLDPATQLGCLVSTDQRDRVERYVAAGESEGARLVAGGRRPSEPPLDQGYYFQPTVFDGVRPGMTIAREEIFGPVLSVIEWTDQEEMLRAVNDNPYGLTAAIYTNDLTGAHRLAAAVECGYVWINDVEKRWIGVPFGGHKDSGTGTEYSVEELHSFSQIKSVSVAL